MDGRTVGFVEAGLEDIGDAQLLRDPHVLGASTKREVARLEYVDTAE
jgi:hypothetical protein